MFVEGGTYTDAGDNFGLSVAIAGNYAIVGSHNEDYDGYSLRGGAYIFYQWTSGDPWGEVEHLSGKAESYSHFGWSVDIDNYGAYDHWAIVGTPYADYGGYGNTGEVRTFERSSTYNWPNRSIITHQSKQANEYFGIPVTIYRGSSVVDGAAGAPYDDWYGWDELGSFDIFKDLDDY